MKLDIGYNYIGDEGVRHISEALQHNTVNFDQVFWCPQNFCIFFSVDTHTTEYKI